MDEQQLMNVMREIHGGYCSPDYIKIVVGVCAVCGSQVPCTINYEEKTRVNLMNRFSPPEEQEHSNPVEPRSWEMISHMTNGEFCHGSGRVPHELVIAR